MEPGWSIWLDLAQKVGDVWENFIMADWKKKVLSKIFSLTLATCHIFWCSSQRLVSMFRRWVDPGRVYSKDSKCRPLDGQTEDRSSEWDCCHLCYRKLFDILITFSTLYRFPSPKIHLLLANLHGKIHLCCMKIWKMNYVIWFVGKVASPIT